MIVRDAMAGDAEAIGSIYNHYVKSTAITFEQDPVSASEMERRIASVLESYPWLVCVEHDSGARSGAVLGYAYAERWKGRCAYRHSAESAVYVAPDATGRGIGTALYAELLPALRAREIHTVIGGIALPNPASIALHERMGFEKVAQFREVGRKFGEWIDVAYYQALLSPAGTRRDG